MLVDEQNAAKRSESLVKRLASLLYAQLPFADRGVPCQPPSHLRRDLGLPPEDLPSHWREIR